MGYSEHLLLSSVLAWAGDMERTPHVEAGRGAAGDTHLQTREDLECFAPSSRICILCALHCRAPRLRKVDVSNLVSAPSAVNFWVM